MQMQDRVVLVTGGASGIGRGVCMVMAERGADAVAADINLEGAHAVAGELERFGHRTGAFQVDVTDSAEIDRMVAGVIKRFGRIDVLVNAAGVIGAPGIGVVDAVATGQRGGHQRHHLVAGVGSACCMAQVQVPVNQLGQAKAQGEGGGKNQPGIGHQAVIVEGDADAVGLVAW